MPPSNVEVIEGLMPDGETDLAVVFRDLEDPEAAAEAAGELEPLLDPELEVVAPHTGRTRYLGPFGLRDYWLDWLRPWESYFAGIESVTADGDRVLVRSCDRGIRRDSDVEVEVHGGSAWTFRDGRIVRIEFFPSSEAFEAAAAT
ncbi:MAG: nuclear transport factor 2 family protein [Actinobacteria bacterium]|nr:nuclear transport factor 2 family protein [Actinomycetota bacterium]